MKSWKTTAAGVAALIAVIATAIASQFDNDPETVAEWGAVVTAVFVALGFAASRDNDKSSETVGAEGGKPKCSNYPECENEEASS